MANTGSELLVAGTFEDQVISPDGSVLFVTSGGSLLAYDIPGGTSAGQWDIGTTLGGISVSADGRYVSVPEWEPTIISVADGSQSVTYSVYVVDTLTSSVARFAFTAMPYDSYFYDSAFLADGTVLLTQEVVGSGSRPLFLLNPADGSFAQADLGQSQAGVINSTSDGETALIVGQNSSLSPVHIYKSGDGVVLDTLIDRSPNVTALTDDGSRIAMALTFFDGQLVKVSEDIVYNANITAEVFSHSGDVLYVLDSASDTVFAYSTATWQRVTSYAVGAEAEPAPWAFGNGMEITADDRLLTVRTVEGIQLVDLATASSMQGTAGDDVLIGGDGADILYGFEGNDILDGGGVPSTGEGNTLYGGPGDDTYYIRSLADRAVEISEDDGYDTVYSSVSFSFTAGIDRVILTDHAPGAQVSGTAIGDDGDNSLAGYIGDDVLIGNGGNDYLDGMGGNDRMVGGAGDDTYVVDSAGDVIVELPDEGTDTVYVQIDYTLAADFENLTFTVYGGETGIGNAADNVILGNQLDNRLEGKGGNDTLIGDDPGLSSFGADTLLGGDGDDILSGLAGIDLLSGGPGSDVFYDTRSGFDGDTITDFSEDDLILFTQTDFAIGQFAFTGSSLSFLGGILTFQGMADGRVLNAVEIPLLGVAFRLAPVGTEGGEQHIRLLDPVGNPAFNVRVDSNGKVIRPGTIGVADLYVEPGNLSYGPVPGGDLTRVFGSNLSEKIALAGDANVLLDPSYVRGNDVVVILGEAIDYTLTSSLAGATVTSENGAEIRIPGFANSGGLTLQFNDGNYRLATDDGGNSYHLTSANSEPVDGPAGQARLFLAPGNQTYGPVPGGDLTEIFGTNGIERVVLAVDANVLLDPSFVRGNDLIQILGDSANFAIAANVAGIIISSDEGAEIRIPAMAPGGRLPVHFDDGTAVVYAPFNSTGFAIAGEAGMQAITGIATAIDSSILTLG